MNKIDWDKVLIEASIAAMQGLQENGKLSFVLDVTPKILAETAVRCGEAMVEELKEVIEHKNLVN